MLIGSAETCRNEPDGPEQASCQESPKVFTAPSLNLRAAWRRCGRVRQAEGERLRQLKDLFAKLGVQRPFVCNSQAAAPLASPVGVPKVRVQIDPNAATGSAMTPEVGAIGPAWTRGEIEKPAGTKDMGGWTAGAATSASP